MIPSGFYECITLHNLRVYGTEASDFTPLHFLFKFLCLMAVHWDICAKRSLGMGSGMSRLRHSSMVSIDDGVATNDAASSPLCSWLGKGVLYL